MREREREVFPDPERISENHLCACRLPMRMRERERELERERVSTVGGKESLRVRNNKLASEGDCFQAIGRERVCKVRVRKRMKHCQQLIERVGREEE